MAPKQDFFRAFEKATRQLGAGLAVAGGVICAAAISGLPAVTCKALAKVYLDAIMLFGISGFSGLATVGMLSFQTVRDWVSAGFIAFMLGIGLLALGAEVLRADSVLADSFAQCWH